MKKILFWGAVSLVLGAILHYGVMSAIPHLVTSRLLSTVFSTSGNWRSEKVNQLFHAAMRTAGTDKVPIDNPDILTSFGFYDVSDQPVRIHCEVPAGISYWSLSLYGWNTDNYFVLNNKQLQGTNVDLVIAGKHHKYTPLPGEIAVAPPGNKGVVLVRIIVRDRNNSGELSAVSTVQKMAYMKTLE
ncbi:MAG: hypothetical protein RL386_723 [Bacteroidota bacterium]|jgi:uncharacterized membrane protein